jgi:hypothetical protein
MTIDAVALLPFVGDPVAPELSEEESWGPKNVLEADWRLVEGPGGDRGAWRPLKAAAAPAPPGASVGFAAAARAAHMLGGLQTLLTAL